MEKFNLLISKKFLFIFSIAIIFINSITAAAEEKNASPDIQGKALIYNFQNTTKNSDFGYYSYIIPDSIYTELRKSQKYIIQSFPVALEYVESGAPKDVTKNYIMMLSDRGKEFNADFIINGSFRVENKIIYIKTQIFTVKDQKFKDIRESTEELGALLMVIIDQLTEKINTELQKGVEQKKAEMEIEEVLGPSPFLGLYSAISGITFGFNYGVASIKGSWGDIYGTQSMATVYLSYKLENLRFLKNIPFVRSLSLGTDYDFFSAETKKDIEFQRTYLIVNGVTGNISYIYKFSQFFFLNGTAGFGAAFSKIELEQESTESSNGPPKILDSRKSGDPYLNLSFGANFLFRHVLFSGGLSYKRIFYSDKEMDLIVVFMGIGYTI